MTEVFYTIFSDRAKPSPDQILELANMDAYTDSQELAQKWADDENARIKDSFPGQTIRVVSFSWPLTSETIR